MNEPTKPIRPPTTLQLAMITRLVLKEFGFRPREFPSCYEAAERMIFALTPTKKTT